jgi:hypothetical protein
MSCRAQSISLIEPSYVINVILGNFVSPHVREAWWSLVESDNGSAELLHYSPLYFELMREFLPGRRVAVAAIRDDSGVMRGAVPLRVDRVPLTYYVRSHPLLEVKMRAVGLPPGRPLVPDDPKAYDLLFQAIAEAFPDCDAIDLPSVPTEGRLWDYLKNSPLIQENFLVHTPEGVREFHKIPLPPTFDEFMAQYRSKRRREFGRLHRAIVEWAGGEPELRKVRAVEDLPYLTSFVRALGWPRTYVRSLPRRYDELASLARRGLLIGYTLSHGDTPIGAIVGLKYKDRVFMETIARNRVLDRFSPGTAVLHRAIEDLIREEGVRHIDLGMGLPRYRHAATNEFEPRARVCLLRKTVANRLMKASYEGFEALKDVVRKCLGRVYPSHEK